MGGLGKVFSGPGHLCNLGVVLGGLKGLGAVSEQSGCGLGVVMGDLAAVLGRPWAILGRPRGGLGSLGGLRAKMSIFHLLYKGLKAQLARDPCQRQSEPEPRRVVWDRDRFLPPELGLKDFDLGLLACLLDAVSR